VATSHCTVDFGATFLDVLGGALQDEERELKDIQRSNPHLWMTSISFYEERWLQYIAVKRAIGMGPTCPRMWVENERVDVSFVDVHHQEIATFELKGPLRIENCRLASQVRCAVAKDFDKQLARASMRQSIPHYVVLVVYGKPGESEQWIWNTFCPTLLDGQAAMRLEWKIAPERIQLNRADRHTEMIVAAARVTPTVPAPTC
jgi:hypothetical protein